MVIVRTTTWSAGPGCHGGCGVLAHMKNGKLVKIEGDPDHPMNRGRLCSRCLAMTQYIDHPERLRSPRKRVGERGEGKWQDISWEEAYDLIEEKMGTIREEHGRRERHLLHGHRAGRGRLDLPSRLQLR